MSSIKPQVPKGFRDFLPAQKIFRQKVIEVIRSIFETYGFNPLETPSLEYAETLEGKYGEEGDRLIYKFEDRGGRAVALRYDLTIPLCRVVSMYPEIAKPFKSYQIAPVWRADKPQRGRFREFYQCDIDIIGTTSVLADAELMVVIHAVLTQLGIKDFIIHINNRKLLNAIASIAGIPNAELAAFLRSLDKLDKIGKEGVSAELLEKGFSAEAIKKVFSILDETGSAKSHREALEIINSMVRDNATGAEGVAELMVIRDALEAQGIPETAYRFDLALARGLDYYTGPVFETRVIAPKIGSITGGGRYDNLIGLFTSAPVPATGSSFGLERLMTVLEELRGAATPDTNTQVLVALFDISLRNESLRIAKMLRDAALKTEIYFEADKLKKQLSYAAQKGIPLVVIVGPDEARNATAALRNMRSSTQEVLAQHNLVQHIKEQLAKA
jgi:histidyl-tRNA synthetase